jgi:hypothetical protein
MRHNCVYTVVGLNSHATIPTKRGKDSDSPPTRRPQSASGSRHGSLFQTADFFDPQDLLQVKYEMLRHVDVDKAPVTEAAAAFGLSRPAFYQARRRLRSRALQA